MQKAKKKNIRGGASSAQRANENIEPTKVAQMAAYLEDPNEADPQMHWIRAE